MYRQRLGDAGVAADVGIPARDPVGSDDFSSGGPLRDVVARAARSKRPVSAWSLSKDLQGTQARLKQLARQDAVRELLVRGEDGTTALQWALVDDASLEFVRVICDVIKDDLLKTNLFTIADNMECTFCTYVHI